MPSDAFNRWRNESARRLDDLVNAHAAVAGPGPGRRWRTEQINWSMIARLAAEFQSFCMELQTLGAQTFAGWSVQGNQAVEQTIRNALTLNRKLDTGNAHTESLRLDFGRFGVDWWTALNNRDPLNENRRCQLDRLNRARNAVAHGDLDRIEALRRDGFPLTLRTFRVWRRALDALAATMDAELADTLSRLFARPAPW